METTYRANVALNGDLGNVIQKEGLTAPEIKILIHLHGLGSVTEIAMYGKESLNTLEERDRLGNFYKPERVAEVFGSYGELPFDIKQLKLDEVLFEKGAAPIGVGGAKKKKKVKKQVTEHLEITEEEPVDEAEIN